jgi:hypothetical protein
VRKPELTPHRPVAMAAMLCSVVLLATASLACNLAGFSGMATDEPTAVEDQTEPTVPADEATEEATTAEPVEATDEPADEPVEEPGGSGMTVADCPEATDSTQLHIAEAAGFCLLAPDDYETQTDYMRPDQAISLFGPPLDESVEPVVVMLRVSSNGPAIDVDDAQSYAERWQQVYLPAGEERPYEAVSAGSEEGILLRGLPSRMAEMTAFFVVGGYKYTVTVSPQPGDIPLASEAAEEVWSTALNSIVFFPPEEQTIVRAVDVCPEPTEGAQLVITLREGFCFLYPAEYEPDDLFATGVTGGPVVEDVPNFGDVRARFVIALHQPAGDQTVAEHMQAFIDAGVNPDTLVETEIAGYPALTYIDDRGPLPSLSGFVQTDDYLYSLVANPYDPATYREQSEVIDEIWGMAIDTLAFFDPWQ